jgi:hypothetical protein
VEVHETGFAVIEEKDSMVYRNFRITNLPETFA